MLFYCCTVPCKPRWVGCNVLLQNNCEFECITHVTIIKWIDQNKKNQEEIERLSVRWMIVLSGGKSDPAPKWKCNGK